MSRKQQRAEQRIKYAKMRKKERFEDFLYKLARRRMKDPEEGLRTVFYNIPMSLERPREEFMAAGQQLVGGRAVFFDTGELAKLLPDWRCSRRRYAIILRRDYIEQMFNEAGQGTW